MFYKVNIMFICNVIYWLVDNEKKGVILKGWFSFFLLYKVYNSLLF
jgi:hypothetical protein